MNPNSGLTLCKILISVCGIIVILSTIGMWFFSSKLEAEKNRKISELKTDLEKKDEEIGHLQVEAKKASRGISSTYDYNGAKRVTTKPGHIEVMGGPEVDVFSAMKKLQDEKKFPELKKICEEQIEKTPTWLTPYLYLGVAYANLGEEEEAIKYFEYVLENAPEDPDYAQAAQFIEKLKK